MNNEIKFISPFKRLCVTVGNLPTAYMESMSYYECLTYFMKFLQNQVIPAINNNSEVVKELQDFVTNYFDNLDVQEEINNKLDDMAESGELAEIIAQYLELNGVLAYDTLSDLKQAENIIDGSTCKTLGKNSINDNNGSFYKIREITEEDTIDEINIVSLEISQTLIAERIKNMYITPEMYGAVGDGITDDSEAFQNFINDECNFKILKENTTYLLNNVISIQKSNIYIKGNNATLKIGNKNNNELLYIYAWDKHIDNIKIENIILDGDKDNRENSDTPIIRIFSGNTKNLNNIELNNCTLKNINGYGIGCYNETSNYNEKYIKIKNCKIYNCDIGIQQSNVSSLIENCKIYNTSSENITVDNGCKNCKIINCNLSTYGHGGSIGIDEATNIEITNNIIDGANNTASETFKNALSINSHTGLCENIIFNENIIKNNERGVSVGTNWSQNLYPSTVNNLSINNNIFISNQNDIFIQQADSNTKINANGNKYGSTPLNKVLGITNNLLINIIKIDVPIYFELVDSTYFTVLKNNNFVLNGIAYLNTLIQSNSAEITEGWKVCVSLPFTPVTAYSNYDPIYDENGNSDGYKEVRTNSSNYEAYWVENETIKKLYLKLELNISY